MALGVTSVELDRRLRLRALRDAGMDPYPHAFPGVMPVGTACGATGDVRVAGRIVARRALGGVVFVDLADRSGELQVLATRRGCRSAHALLSRAQPGDIIGVDGRMSSTRSGTLALHATSVAMLAKALRPPPDPRVGVRQDETRVRQPEIAMIADRAARDRIITRAHIVSAIRRFLDGEGFIEVETPILQPIYGGAAARPFVTRHNALGCELYLRIATELYLKRAIVGGFERVYEIGRNFRNEGLSPRHNPEFTMIEWYEAYSDYDDVARRFEALMRRLAEFAAPGLPYDLSSPWRRETVCGAIASRTGVDVLALRDVEKLRAAARRRHVDVPPDCGWEQIVEHLVTRYVEPTLIEPTLLLDHPVELSPLAKRHRADPRLVERFEAYVGGMELANAFTELNDPDDQRSRLEAERDRAAAGYEEAHPLDEEFLAALEHGMPPTGGIGIGIDRLTMVLTGATSIRETILFPTVKARGRA
jgi:lysyl-tRNA synthetase class 2